MSLDPKHTEASFSPHSTDLLNLQLAQVPTSPDLAIFVSMMTTMTTRPITLPLAHACGVIRRLVWLSKSCKSLWMNYLGDAHYNCSTSPWQYCSLRLCIPVICPFLFVQVCCLCVLELAAGLVFVETSLLSGWSLMLALVWPCCPCWVEDWGTIFTTGLTLCVCVCVDRGLTRSEYLVIMWVLIWTQ